MSYFSEIFVASAIAFVFFALLVGILLFFMPRKPTTAGGGGSSFWFKLLAALAPKPRSPVDDVDYPYFVVCNKDSSIAAVIELDDSSHNRTERQSADAKKDKALGSAGVRVIRWQVSSMPNTFEIRAAFATPKPVPFGSVKTYR